MSRIRWTRSTASVVPESLRPAARIWITWRRRRSGSPSAPGRCRPARARQDRRLDRAGVDLGVASELGHQAPLGRQVAGCVAPPGRPVSIAIWLGASAPGPSVSSRSASPSVDSVVSGTPRLSPPVRWSWSAGIASASISPPAPTRYSTGRRMIERDRRVQRPGAPRRGRRGCVAGSPGSG